MPTTSTDREWESLFGAAPEDAPEDAPKKPAQKKSEKDRESAEWERIFGAPETPAAPPEPAAVPEPVVTETDQEWGQLFGADPDTSSKFELAQKSEKQVGPRLTTGSSLINAVGNLGLAGMRGIAEAAHQLPLNVLNVFEDMDKGVAEGEKMFPALAEDRRFRRETTRGFIERGQEKIPEYLGTSETIPEEITEVLSQWFTVGGPIARVSKIKSSLAKWWLADMAGVAAFDPYDPTISNAIADAGIPGLSEIADRYLVADPKEETALEALTMKLVEAATIGVVGEGAIRGAGALAKAGPEAIRLFRFRKGLREAKKDFEKAKQSRPEEVPPRDPEEPPTVAQADAEVSKVQDLSFSDMKSLLDEATRTGQYTPMSSEDLARMITGEHGVPEIVVKRDPFGEPRDIVFGGEAIQFFEMLNKTAPVETVPVRLMPSGLEKAPKRSRAPGTSPHEEPTPDLEEFYKKEREARSRLVKAFDATQGLFSAQGWVDYTRDVTKPLLRLDKETGGRFGKNALRDLQRRAGGNPRGEEYRKIAQEKIYGGLNRTDRNHVDEILTSTRAIRAGKRVEKEVRKKTKAFDEAGIQTELGYEWEKKMPGGQSPADHAIFLKEKEGKLGTAKFKDLEQRADTYTRAVGKQLLKLRRARLLDKKQLQQLLAMDFDVEGNYLKELDQLWQRGVSRRTMSGIAHVDKRLNEGMELTPEHFLHEVFIRSENLIGHAEADRSLAEILKSGGSDVSAFIRSVPGDSLNKQRKYPIPKGFTPLEYIDAAGKPKMLHVDKTFNEEWVLGSPHLDAATANVMRIASGSVFVRPLATGANPEFALYNFFRDNMYIYNNVPEEVGFSAQAPVYEAQFMKDVQEVAGQALKKKGPLWDMFVREGGLQDFLTHQGRDILMTGDNTKLLSQLGDRLNVSVGDTEFAKVGRALSYINEFSEIVSRMAVMNRGLKSELSPADAVWHSRRYLDFHQGGVWAKRVDQLWPYFNARLQVVRGLARSLRDERGARTATKLGYIAGSGIGFMATNYALNPRGYNDLAQEDNYLNWIFMLPPAFDYRDSSNTLKSRYFSVPKDESVAALTALPEVFFNHWMTGEPVDRAAEEHAKAMFRTTAKGLLPISGNLPPTIEFLVSYAGDQKSTFDTRPLFGEPLGKGPGDIRASEEIRTLPAKQPSGITQAVTGGLSLGGLEVSPTRLEGAARNLLPKNPYMMLLNDGSNAVFSALNPEFRARDKAEGAIQPWAEHWEKDVPGISKLMKSTHPQANKGRLVREAGVDTRTDIYNSDATFKNMYEMDKAGVLDGGQKTIDSFIENQPETEKGALHSQWQDWKAIDKALGSTDLGLQGIPQRDIWEIWLREDPEVRAELFYNDLRIYNSSARDKKMWKIAQEVPGFVADRFLIRYQQFERGERVPP